jgi:hypothetical protein
MAGAACASLRHYGQIRVEYDDVTLAGTYSVMAVF